MYNVDNKDSKDNVIRLISWAFFFDETFEFSRHVPCLLIHTYRIGLQVTSCKVHQY